MWRVRVRQPPRLLARRPNDPISHNDVRARPTIGHDDRRRNLHPGSRRNQNTVRLDNLSERKAVEHAPFVRIEIGDRRCRVGMLGPIVGAARAELRQCKPPTSDPEKRIQRSSRVSRLRKQLDCPADVRQHGAHRSGSPPAGDDPILRRRPDSPRAHIPLEGGTARPFRSREVRRSRACRMDGEVDVATERYRIES